LRSEAHWYLPLRSCLRFQQLTVGSKRFFARFFVSYFPERGRWHDSSTSAIGGRHQHSRHSRLACFSRRICEWSGPVGTPGLSGLKRLAIVASRTACANSCSIRYGLHVDLSAPGDGFVKQRLVDGERCGGGQKRGQVWPYSEFTRWAQFYVLAKVSLRIRMNILRQQNLGN
jgi:hypothetical protein